MAADTPIRTGVPLIASAEKRRGVRPSIDSAAGIEDCAQRFEVGRLGAVQVVDSPALRGDHARTAELVEVMCRGAAGDADRGRIEDAFARSGCVVAEGHFDGETLVVLRIAGECRHWFPVRPAE